MAGGKGAGPSNLIFEAGDGTYITIAVSDHPGAFEPALFVDVVWDMP